MGLLEDTVHWRSKLHEACRPTEPPAPPTHPRREPIHTLYWGAHRFDASTLASIGSHARRSFERYATTPAMMAEAFRIDRAVAESLHGVVTSKLAREPIEDLRIDFEDGYGVRPDPEEDEAAQRAAKALAAAAEAGVRPRRAGIRIKALTPELFERSVRTLETFVTSLVDEQHGEIQDFVVTLPKVTVPEQLSALDDLLTRLELRLGLPDRTIGLEFMVEVPSAVFDREGRLAFPALVDAAGQRLLGVHLGVYDYTAAHQIAAHQIAMDHPACDLVRGLMVLGFGGRGLMLSAGSTNVLPVAPHPEIESLSADQRRSNLSAVHRGWRTAHDQIRHTLRRGYYHGWDLHPAQLPARFVAAFGFYAEGAGPMCERMRQVLAAGSSATDDAAVLDDLATGQALFDFFRRGHGCGALSSEQLHNSGLTPEDLELGSYADILAHRRDRTRGGLR